MGATSTGYILHADTVPGAASEGYKVSIHVWIVITEPSLRAVLARFRIGDGVIVHVVRAHADRSVLWNRILFVLESDIWRASR
jgi:hypothetical protein